MLLKDKIKKKTFLRKVQFLMAWALLALLFLNVPFLPDFFIPYVAAKY